VVSHVVPLRSVQNKLPKDPSQVTTAARLNGTTHCSAILITSSDDYPMTEAKEQTQQPSKKENAPVGCLTIHFILGTHLIYLISIGLARYHSQVDISRHELRTAMHHLPKNHERTLNLSILLSSDSGKFPAVGCN